MTRTNASMKENTHHPRKITGYHATAMFVLFFGVIAAVNFLMASLALSSFGGTVVDNSYVASQNYNDWLAQGREQAALGWTISPAKRQGDKLQIRAETSVGEPLVAAAVEAIAMHPVGRADEIALGFTEIAPGIFTTLEPLPPGRWKVKLTISRGQQVFKRVDDVR